MGRRGMGDENTMLASILKITIVVLIVLFCILPIAQKEIKKIRKTSDIAYAKKIAEVVYKGLALEKIEYPVKDIYVIVETEEEVSIGLNSGYRENVVRYLKENLNVFKTYTRLDKNQRFVIKIAQDGTVSIYQGSYFGSQIYPNQTGDYLNE